MTIQCRSHWAAECVLPLGHDGEHIGFSEHALAARLALSGTDRGSLFARLCETEARLAEAERLLRGVAAVGYDGPAWDAIDAFLRPADSASGVQK